MLTIRDARVLRGPNVWARVPVVHLVVDLGELEDRPTNKIPWMGTWRRTTAPPLHGARPGSSPGRLSSASALPERAASAACSRSAIPATMRSYVRRCIPVGFGGTPAVPGSPPSRRRSPFGRRPYQAAWPSRVEA